MGKIKSQNFLGEAKLVKLMLKFSVPCVLSLLVSALYNIVDQIFIGNSELSALGNAATGVVFPVFVIAQAFAWCIGDGCAAFLNIRQGKGDSGKLHKTVGGCITVTLIISGILLAVFYPLKTRLLYLFGASDNSIGYAVQYFDIIVAFFPVFMLSNMLNSVIRADGSPAFSMASMLAGTVTNIALDPAFIFGCNWGMAGAAWATVAGQTVSLVISIAYFFKSKTFRLALRSFIPSFKAVAPAVKLGISTFITQMTIVVVAVVSNVMLVKYGALSVYGKDIPIAVIAIENKVFTIVINIVVGVILGCQPIIGYNLGCENYGRVKKLYLYILAVTVAVGAVATVLFEACPSAIVGIFGTPDGGQDISPELYREFGVKTFRIFLMFILFTCTVKMTSIFFQAIGRPVLAIIASLVRDIVCFVPLVCTLPIAVGIDGCLWAAPIADGIAIIVTVALTIICFKDLDKKAKNAVSTDICADEREILSES